ncbi:reverse transcriptase domain-containing protein [Tanacetum coccineum]
MGKIRQRQQKGGNLRKRQVDGNINGTTMSKDSKTKNYSNFLSGVSNFFSTPMGRGWDGRFRPEVKNQMIPAAIPLVGFSGEIIWPLGQISLLVKIGEEHSTSAWMNFMVVRSPSPYNGIIGRPGVRKIRAIPSTAHGILKFLVTGGIVTLWSSKIIPLECMMVSGPGVLQPVINQVVEEKIQVATHSEYPEQTVAIDSTLTEEGRKELCDLLRRNLDKFAWKPAYMTGVPRHIAEHRLDIREGCLPVRQKKKGQAPERNKAICEEVEKLVDADIMKEVHYHSWLSNPVMVKNTTAVGEYEKEVLAVVEEEGRTWMTPVYEYLTEGILPEEKRKARVVHRKAGRYDVINETLYKKSFLGPWLQCVEPLHANYVLREIHKGSCSMHSEPRSMVVKALRSGYYWPTMHMDARNFIRECSDCQGIDIAGPFLEGPGKVKFLIVAMDYFTKWIEVKPVATIPRITHLKIERANRSLGEGIKARLGEKNKNWVEEISHVLWAHRTLIKSSNGETPFSLTYGAEAVIPMEIGMPTLRTAKVDMIKNNEALGINLDLLEERREQAAI